MDSPFLEVDQREWILSNEHAFAIYDRFPVSRGHVLVVTRRCVETWFDADAEEQAAVWDLVNAVKLHLDLTLEPKPDGYNVGFNAGEAAGQTVMHLHVHVIPRYTGDMDDPRGGVRGVIPWKQKYGEDPEVENTRLSRGTVEDPFLDHIGPLLDRSTDVAILAAFVMQSGVEVLASWIHRSIDRGARIRILTGDYLCITQSQALRLLLDICQQHNSKESAGQIETRVVEISQIKSFATTFHPKAWIFEGGDGVACFVGSSNLSRAALIDGVEWNLRVNEATDRQACGEIRQEYERWWSKATTLDDEWLQHYRLRVEQNPQPIAFDAQVELEVPTPRPPIQIEALDALRRCREVGRGRTLLVMATGLGKTWVSAFDVKQFEEEQSGRVPRVLFIAHRVEILRQAAAVFRRMFPEASFGFLTGGVSQPDADFVFASIMKLANALETIDLAAFDYVIVDEVHHAAAPTYRRVIGSLEAHFVMGMTATPDRADQGDILGLFDDHVAYRADLGRGIQEEQLAPFRYLGVRDTVDYAPIPWRNRQFDTAVLESAVQTEERMEELWRAWNRSDESRTLIFCCTIDHARYVTHWLTMKGVKVACVHSADDSNDRYQSVQHLAAGSIDAICTVDLFNEGVDIPVVDRVVMLRPTESPVVFLQQLGRSLRRVDAEKTLQVIDFVGNHRTFLARLQTLISSFGADGRTTTIRQFLDNQEFELPPGCSVELELEAIELLRQLVAATQTSNDVFTSAYRQQRDVQQERPTMGEMYRLGYDADVLDMPWFEFLHSEGDLTELEIEALTAHRRWFRVLKDERISKSFKMVTLQGLLDLERLFDSVDTVRLARHCRHLLLRDPELRTDITGVVELGDVDQVSEETWTRYWTKNPLVHLSNKETSFFTIEGDQFRSLLNVSEDLRPVVAKMTSEFIDHRLAKYRVSRVKIDSACKVISNQRDPIIKLDRNKHPELPTGEVEVIVNGGERWVFRFVKIACNVACPAGQHENELPRLLHSWFGADAGKPGTAFHVRFAKNGPDWTIEPYNW